MLGRYAMATIVSRPGTAGETITGRRPYVMLGMATVGFALTFWAWALLSPLGAYFKQSLGRIPVGALTDRYGGRLMFPVISFATIGPVLFLGLVGYRSLAGVLAGGFFLGLAGTSFAVGVPFVNAWFPPGRRGLAIGIFGMGTGGTAISALT